MVLSAMVKIYHTMSPDQMDTSDLSGARSKALSGVKATHRTYRLFTLAVVIFGISFIAFDMGAMLRGGDNIQYFSYIIAALAMIVSTFSLWRLNRPFIAEGNSIIASMRTEDGGTTSNQIVRYMNRLANRLGETVGEDAHSLEEGLKRRQRYEALLYVLVFIFILILVGYVAFEEPDYARTMVFLLTSAAVVVSSGFLMGITIRAQSISRGWLALLRGIEGWGAAIESTDSGGPGDA
jgi:hypothetical protein